MAMDATDAHIMLEAARHHPDQVTQIVPAPHTLNLDKTIKELIEEGYVGDVLSVDASITQGGFIDLEKQLTVIIDTLPDSVN